MKMITKSNDIASNIITILTITAASSFCYYCYLYKEASKSITNDKEQETEIDDDTNEVEISIHDRRLSYQNSFTNNNQENTLYFPRQSYTKLSSLSHFADSSDCSTTSSIEIDDFNEKSEVNKSDTKRLQRTLSPLYLQQPQMPNFMPKRIILIRHGQSMGNVKEHLYSTIPDQ